MNTILDDGLAEYFTDAELIRARFKELSLATILPKRMLIIHGIGGVGKSSLLSMFRLQCKSAHIPAALASGDESKSASAILADWANELRSDGTNMSVFLQEMQRYRTLQAKAEEKIAETQKRFTSATGKAVEGVTSATVGAAIGSLVPGIGIVMGALGGAGAEAFVDWLRGQGFSKADIDLLLDADHRLTDKFLATVDEAASKGRIVLLLDTTEQLALIDEWICSFAQRLHPNVLLVLAGRSLPNWSRKWPGYLASSLVEELRPMTEDTMRNLVHRYYATQHGGQPDPKQVEAIVRFGRGLPIAVTTAVRLWIEYGLEDFDTIKAEVVADLIDRLKEGVSPEVSGLIEAAASVRWFNKEILRVVADVPSVNHAYDELRHFPFVRPRAEGLALHDTVRQLLNEYLFVHDPEQFYLYHTRATEYFKEEAAKRTGQDAQKLQLERLYHEIAADEAKGVLIFREHAEELARFRLVGRLKQLLTDVSSYRYEFEAEANSLWLDYYDATLAIMESRIEDAEVIFERISSAYDSPELLRAYALCSWGAILERGMRLWKVGGKEKATKTLLTALKLLPPHDRRRFDALVSLIGVHNRLQEYDLAIPYLDQAQSFAEQTNDVYLKILTWRQRKNRAALLGDWNTVIEAHKAFEELLVQVPVSDSLIEIVYGHWATVWNFFGQHHRAEEYGKKGLAALNQLGIKDIASCLRDVGYALGMQGDIEEAEHYFMQSINVAQQLQYRQGLGISNNFWGIVLTQHGRADEGKPKLLEALEIKQTVHDIAGVPEALISLGRADEILGNYTDAENWYRQCVHLYSPRRNFDCAAKVGLARVLTITSKTDETDQLVTNAEAIAQQYEYNDSLAWLRILAAYQCLHDSVQDQECMLSKATGFIQQSMVYALRFNRFLLDGFLSGKLSAPVGSIIGLCTQGSRGATMLPMLRDWWLQGFNSLDTDKTTTISPVPLGIRLLEAEQMARQLEPGDGMPQTTVLNQIDSALKML